MMNTNARILVFKLDVSVVFTQHLQSKLTSLKQVWDICANIKKT